LPSHTDGGTPDNLSVLWPMRIAHRLTERGEKVAETVTDQEDGVGGGLLCVSSICGVDKTEREHKSRSSNTGEVERHSVWVPSRV
jgi:hypothetical protein